MRTFLAHDTFEEPTRQVFVVKRPNPKAKAEKTELPNPGELVQIGGKTVRVIRSQFVRDNDFNWCPEILIHATR